MSYYTHLSMKDRQRFCTYLQMGLSIKEISLRLDRHRSTLYRELNRNKEYGLYKKMGTYVIMLSGHSRKAGVLSKFQVE